METLKPLKPYPGLLPKEFKKAVAMLMRPYLPITEEFYNYLMEQLGREQCDFFILENGHIVTIGTANSGYAIMPLLPGVEANLKENNNDRI